MERNSQKREREEEGKETKAELKETETKEIEKDAKIPKILKWGSGSVSSGILSATGESKFGLFGSKSLQNITNGNENGNGKTAIPTLKWGSGKSSFLEKLANESKQTQQQTTVSEENIQDKKASEKESKSSGETEPIVSQAEEQDDTILSVRVKAYELVDREYKGRGKGLLKEKEKGCDKYQIVLRREGEEGGMGTVLVFNSLLYPSTPIKDVDDGYFLITLPESENKLTSYLIKAVDERKTEELKENLKAIIAKL